MYFQYKVYYNFYLLKMIKSAVTFINNLTKLMYPSAVAIVEGRANTTLQQKLEYHYNNQRKVRLEQQAFKIQIANMGKTQAELFTLKRAWRMQTTDLTVQEYAQAIQRLQDKLEQQRQARNRDLGHI